jgi:hypothetical protein
MARRNHNASRKSAVRSRSHEKACGSLFLGRFGLIQTLYCRFYRKCPVFDFGILKWPCSGRLFGGAWPESVDRSILHYKFFVGSHIFLDPNNSTQIYINTYAAVESGRALLLAPRTKPRPF